MSLFLKSSELAYLNDHDTEDMFLLKDENEDYNFKYVPTNRFKYIARDVRRQRCREEEEIIWASFVKQQELNDLIYSKNDIQPSVQTIKEILDEGIKEANNELGRQEIDVLSDRVRKEYDKIENTQKKKSKVNNIRDLSSKKASVMKDTGTGSTNLLLTIPEEDNTSIDKRKQKPKEFKSYTRKSRSSHAISRKKQSSKQLLQMTNNIEYNSSPESSARYDGVADGAIYIRPDPFIMRKILTIQKKICELLDEIALRLENIPPPDGVKDLQRRQQCVSEFVVRFSRNYLYDLNRYVKDIQRHMYIISPRARVKPNQRSLGLHMHAIEHKLLSAHQLLLHALVAYCKHIPSSILKGHPLKFREILQIIVDLKILCDRLHLNTNYLDSGDTEILPLGKNIENKCNIVLSKLKLFSDDFPLDNIKTPSVASVTPHSTNNKKHVNRKQLSNRLSMYNTNKVLKNDSKQKIKHYHQKDKKYSAVDIKRISNEMIPVDQPFPSPVTFTSSKDANQLEIKKHRTYTKEEDIKTVMDMLPIDSDDDSNFQLQEIHDNAFFTRRRPETSKKFPDKVQDLEQYETVEQIVKSVPTNNDELVKRVTMITEEHLSNLVPVIADIMSFINKQDESEVRPMSAASMKTLMEFLQKYQLPKSADTKTSANTNCDVCRSSMSSSCGCEHLQKKISSGRWNNRENMRLICVSSMENASKIPQYCDASCQADCNSPIELPNFEVKVKQGKQIRDSSNNIELVVSEETETNFLKYRREYQRLTQSIPMYFSNTQNKPWDIVAWISDKLVNELITEITKEMQMDDVIQKLFELEFQEF